MCAEPVLLILFETFFSVCNIAKCFLKENGNDDNYLDTS